MWLPNNIIAEVNNLVRVYYIDSAITRRWNEHRDENDLRLLTGWCWSTRNNAIYRMGFKTMTVAYTDAWYVLIAKRSRPLVNGRGIVTRTKPVLRLVRSA